MRMKRIALPVIAVIAAATLAAVAGWLDLDNKAQAQTNLPAPANVQVVNGDTPGQVVVSWDAVAGASGYRISWADNDAAWDAFYAGHDWQQLILSVDVSGGEATTHTLTVSNPTTGAVKYQFRVGSKASPDATPANWSAWQVLDVRGDANPDVQALAAALSISRNASELAASSGPTRFGMTPADLVQSAAAVAEHKAALSTQLEILAGIGYSARADRITALVNDLVSNTESIEQGRRPLLGALVEGNLTRQRLTRIGTTQLSPAAEKIVDDEFFDLVAGVHDGESTASGELSRDDILRYTHLSSLLGNLEPSTTSLLSAGTLDNPALMGRIQERYETVAAPVYRDIEYLSDNGDPNFEKLVQLTRVMLDHGRGDDNLFDRAEHRISLITGESVLIAKNNNILQRLLVEIDALAADVQGNPQPPTAPDAEAGEPGATDDEIRFGQSAALMGPATALGTGMQLGIQAAFHEANQAGGISGRLLKLTTLNDDYEDVFAFASTQQLIERHRVFGLIGAVGTPTSRAALPLAEAGNVPFVGAFTGAQLLREDDQDFILNVRASYHDETEEMVAYLEGMGITRVAVLYQKDSYGQDGLAGVQKALDQRDGMELAAHWYYPRNTTAVKGAAYRIARAEPDAVIIIGAYASTAEFIRQLRLRLMDDPIFMAVSFVGSNALRDELVRIEEPTSDVYVTQVVPLPSDESDQLVAAYRAALSAYDSEAQPGFISLEGYLAGRLAIERLEACGADVTRRCFLNVFDESTSIDLSGFELEYGPDDNQGSDVVFLTRINDAGQFELVAE